jgi:hypothetical protein
MSVTPSAFCAGRRSNTHPGAAESQIAAVELRVKTQLPPELREFLKFTDGFEGFVGPEATGWYLNIRSTSELIRHNEMDGFKEQWPELIQFAGDGGGAGFFFDPTRTGPPVLMIDYISNWHEDSILYANSMGEFFDRMHSGYDPYKRSTEDGD